MVKLIGILVFFIPLALGFSSGMLWKENCIASVLLAGFAILAALSTYYWAFMHGGMVYRELDQEKKEKEKKKEELQRLKTNHYR